MSSLRNLIAKFKRKPKDLTWGELVRLLKYYGYELLKSGKTSGVRRKFLNKERDSLIILHEPHPKKVVKVCQIKGVYRKLEEEGLL